MEESGIISAPSRLCLFGEHQDYLSLPIIACAVNRRLNIDYEVNHISQSYIVTSEHFEESEEVFRNSEGVLNGSVYDYIKAVHQYHFKVNKDNPKEIFDTFPQRIHITSQIPIGGGMSSSAAILVATVFLYQRVLLRRESSAKSIAEIAYRCEHDLMGISCGRMDQYSSAIGGVFHMTSTDNPVITKLSLPDCYLVIGDSLISRQADKPLKKVQFDIFNALKSLGNPSLVDLQISEDVKTQLTTLEIKRLTGVIGIRDNTIQAFEELNKSKPDLNYLGRLLTEQQQFLSHNYEVSHPKLNLMCEMALKNGALGAKLTGAGFGGCMFALCDNETTANKVKKELNRIGQALITQTDEGVKIIEN